ncbi:hypothetical protein [Promicromonospora soli]
MTLILFAAYTGVARPSIQHPTSVPSPDEVRTYHLEDPERRLKDIECYEHDLIFERLPQDLEEIVSAWLEAVLEAGAKIAWFGFEGSFDFEHILTADVANQVFAAGTARRVEFALEDDRREGQAWIETLADLRRHLQL